LISSDVYDQQGILLLTMARECMRRVDTPELKTTPGESYHVGVILVNGSCVEARRYTGRRMFNGRIAAIKTAFPDQNVVWSWFNFEYDGNEFYDSKPDDTPNSTTTTTTNTTSDNKE